MVKRGEIYFDPQYEYGAGNKADKYLIVLNKSHSSTDPLIIVPVTTDKNNKYKKGCNHKSFYFRIDANQDFFPNDTLVQLDMINITMVTQKFIDKQSTQGFKLCTTLSQATIDAIMKCLAQLKDDIDTCLHAYLF